MSIKLDKKALENIKAYRYQTHGLTFIERNGYEYFWNFVVAILPEWIAPNLMTLAGLIFPILQFFFMLYYDWTFSETLPQWVWLHGVFAFFWYQTMDACDGKQARKTDNCSSLGQLLDHNLDQISYTIFFLGVCAICKTGPNFWMILLCMPAIFTPHYSIEFRKHFTKIHVTVVGVFGATESLTFMMMGFSACGFSPLSNVLLEVPRNLYGFEFTIGQFILYSTFLSGLHYNLENIYYGFKGANDKTRAFKAIFPYIQLYILAYLQTYSQFYERAPLLFFSGLGLFQTYVTGLLNISSTADIDFPYNYYEPYLFLAILYLDAQRLVAPNLILAAYSGIVFFILVKYLLFLYSMITQLTSFLGIKFLKVKDIKKTQ